MSPRVSSFMRSSPSATAVRASASMRDSFRSVTSASPPILGPNAERHPMTTVTKSASIATGLILAAAATGQAAAPIRWQPAHMQAALLALQYPHPGTVNAKCVGIGKRQPRGFTAFRCLTTWETQGPPAQYGRIRVWARPAGQGRICASTGRLASCQIPKPGPLPGDPRVCAGNGTDPAVCALEAARLAMRKHLATGGILYQPPTSCKRGPMTVTRLEFDCLADTTPETVVYTRGRYAWTVTVMP